MPPKTLQIRNSVAEFLIFSKQAGENGIEVRVQDGTIWLSQKLMAALFDCTPENITMHLKNIFAEGELDEISVTKDFLVTAAGNSQFVRHFLTNQASLSRKASCNTLDRLNPDRATLSSIHLGILTVRLTALVFLTSARMRFTKSPLDVFIFSAGEALGISCFLSAR